MSGITVRRSTYSDNSAKKEHWHKSSKWAAGWCDSNNTWTTLVHSECRKQYCNKHLISKHLREGVNPPISTPSRSLRSQIPAFNFQEHCLFCSYPVTCVGKKRSQDDTAVFLVRTDDFQDRIKTVCKERGDDWADQVHSRIEFCSRSACIWCCISSSL